MRSRLTVFCLAAFLLAAGPATNPTATPKLGVKAISLEDARKLEGIDPKQLPRVNGLYVVEVSANSDAERAGIKAGDVLISIDNVVFKTSDALGKWLTSAKFGRTYTMRTLSADGWKPKAVAITLTKPKPGPVQAETRNASNAIALPDGSSLTVEQDSPTLYIPQGIPAVYLFNSVSCILRRADGEFIQPASGFYEINGKPEKLSVNSADESLFTIERDKRNSGSSMYDVVAKSEGKTTFKVSLAGKSIDMGVEIVRLPLAIGASADDVIKAYGMPTARKLVLVSWPDTEEIDGLIYSPKAGSAVNAEHWRFDKLPNAVFSIQHDKLQDVGSHK